MIPAWLLSKTALQLLVVAGVGVGGFMAGVKIEGNTWRAKWDARELAIASQVAQATAEAREREAKLQEAADAARSSYDNAVADIRAKERSIARLRVDRDQLHNDLAAFAAGSPGADTLAACQSRAERLATSLAGGAELVAEGAELVREAALDADIRAAKLSACLSAWPK